MFVKRFSPNEWEPLSEIAHFACFGEIRPRDLDNIDFAVLVSQDENHDHPICYATIQVVSKGHCYMQYGGAFPEHRGTPMVVKAYKEILRNLSTDHVRANTLIENTNRPMLKLAMNEGWLITGIRLYDDSLLIEHSLKFKEAS